MLGQFQTPSFNFRNEVTKTAAYTLVKADEVVKASGTTTLTLPSIAALMEDGLGDKTYKIVNANTTTATVTITANSLDKINDGSSAGASSVYLYDVDDYAILQANPVKLKWEYVYPSPRMSADDYIKDYTVGGLKTVSKKYYGSVAALTTGTTAVNVFGTGGAPCNLTLTSLLAIAVDTVAANIILTNGTDAVGTLAKSETANAVTGLETMGTYTSVTAADTVTIESSATNGQGLCVIGFTVP